jgi:putative spermidine/putrescine transport system substrate-binding protein/spermidine/putrescine transport system substrate-binding protein
MFNRRQFIGTAAAVGVLATPFIARAAKRDLRIAVWAGYAEPEWVKPFEAENDVEVKITYLTSDEEFFAKMRGSNGAGVDVFSLNTSLVPRYQKLSLVKPIDGAKISRFDRLTPVYRDVEDLNIDGKLWGVPFAWGSQPLIYDKAQFSAAPDSWQVMWDPENAQRLINFDDPGTITLAALLLGFPNPYKLDKQQLQACKEKLIEQKKLLMTYYTGFDDGVRIFAENGIKAMLSIGELQQVNLKKLGIDAGLVIPKEGATGWLDCWIISAGVRDGDLAHAWINNCMADSVGSILSTKLKYGNTTNAAANEENGLTYADRLFFAQQAEDQEARTALWNEIKAA